MADIAEYTGLNRADGMRITGKEHLLQSLHDVLMTPVGSRVMRRDYGSVLPFLVDQPMTQKNLMKIRAAVAHSIAKWEPRVELTSVFVKGSMYTGIDISLEYKSADQADKISIDGLFA